MNVDDCLIIGPTDQILGAREEILERFPGRKIEKEEEQRGNEKWLNYELLGCGVSEKADKTQVYVNQSLLIEKLYVIVHRIFI